MGILNLFSKHKDYQNWYFETSSVNYLLDNVFSSPQNSSIKTRKLQLKKKRKWYISNITLWEIFLTKDKVRRELLFDFSRCLFYKKLMPSVEELIINYIDNGLPIIENRYELKSKSLFSQDWKKSCENQSYFFEPNVNDLIRHTKYYRFLGEYFVKTNKGYILDFSEKIYIDKKEIELGKIEISFSQLIGALEPKEYKSNEQYIHLSFKLVLVILCFGINFNQKITENYWFKVGVNDLYDRIGYVVKNIPEIFYRGPISNIAKMILNQAGTNSSRGVYFDALHSIYITYSDLYFSEDEHFYNLKAVEDPNMFKIRRIRDIIKKT